MSTGVVMRFDQRLCRGECHKVRVVKFFVGDSKICFTCQQLTLPLLCSKRKINASTSPFMDFNTSVLHCSKCNRDYELYKRNWICHGCSTRSPEYRFNLKIRKQMKIMDLEIPKELLSEAKLF